jgi:hypothetical protein
MLKFVDGPPLALRCHSQDTAGANIFVNVVDIRVGMMQYVVLDFPIERACT